MREILFRLWNKRTKNWESSFYLGDYGRIVTEGPEGIEAIEFNGDDLVLMQFTGLKDRNGKEIYEYDVVKLVNGHWDGGWENPCVVKFEDGKFFPWGTGDWEYEPEEYVVIGNLYENPDLLKK